MILISRIVLEVRKGCVHQHHLAPRQSLLLLPVQGSTYIGQILVVSRMAVVQIETKRDLCAENYLASLSIAGVEHTLLSDFDPVFVAVVVG